MIRDGKITCDLIWRKDVVTCLEGKGLPLAFISVIIARETVTGSDFWPDYTPILNFAARQVF